MRPGTAILLAAALMPIQGFADDEASATNHPQKIELRQTTAGDWRFFVNDQEFPLRGAGGAEAPGLLEQLKEAGGNCVRTWGIQTLEARVTNGERFIDRAHQLGIMVIPGLWVQHERHGFDYADPAFITQQRTQLLAQVRAYRNHPAVLAWGLGNEMEGPADPTGSVVVLKEVEELAKLVKQEDPHRPVMTVIAFTGGGKVANLKQYCPSIDILGLNTYGAAAGAGAAVKAAGWTKPFAITEFGVNGFWEVGKTDWGAPYEPTSQEKGRSFYAAHRMVFELNDGKELCLGTFAFLWGWKQEKTATWFGMFLPSLEKLAPVDAMARVWTGHWPTNRCPVLHALNSPAAAKRIPPDQEFTATVDVDDPNGDILTFEWLVKSESTAKSVGGEEEYTPAAFPDLITGGSNATTRFRSPEQPGDYRLFVTVRDQRGGAATANFPFQVAP